jgi:hypothetical protein
MAVTAATFFEAPLDATRERERERDARTPMDGCDLFDRCTTAALPLPPATAVAPTDDGVPTARLPPVTPPAAPSALAPAAYERRAGNDDADAAPSDDPLLPTVDA